MSRKRNLKNQTHAVRYCRLMLDKGGLTPEREADLRRILADAEEWLSGRCSKCGRELLDPESVELGMGPECRRQERRKAS